jgi:hypothetical protein
MTCVLPHHTIDVSSHSVQHMHIDVYCNMSLCKSNPAYKMLHVSLYLYSTIEFLHRTDLQTVNTTLYTDTIPFLRFSNVNELWSRLFINLVAARYVY